MSATCLECHGTGRSCTVPGFPCSTCDRKAFLAQAEREELLQERVGLIALAQRHHDEWFAMRAERDEARAENKAIRVRATHAHNAVYQAMALPAQEALAALQDEGAVHRAIHEIFCGPEGTAAYPLDEAMQAHVDEMERRALAAENERDEARRERDEAMSWGQRHHDEWFAMRAERDRWKAAYQDMSGTATAFKNKWSEAERALDSVERERGEARAEVARWREAAGSLVADLERPMGDLTAMCEYPTCRRLAMLNDGDQDACDQHRAMLVDGDIEDCSYAPALRALRAMLAKEAP